MSEAITKALDEFEIQAITTAYEQGFGHAWRTELSNPYPEGAKTRTAWQYGRDAGQRQTPQPAPSPQPAVPVVSEDDLVACLISSGCVGTVKMSFESGPMSITRPSLNATKFARAILALRPQAEPDWRDTEIARLKAVISALEEQQLRAVAAGLLRPQAVPMTDDQIVQGQEQQGAQSILSFMKGVRFVEAHHGITAKAEGEEP